MSEAEAGAGAAALAAAGGEGDGGAGGDGAGGQGGGEQQQQVQVPEWMAALPDELKADATLSRYASIEDLAKGHVEARKVASSRILLPGADADDAAWGKFGEALRPAEAKEYDIPLPEGADPEGPMGKFAEAFRAHAFEIGMPARWAKATAEWNNEHIAAETAASNAAMAADLDAFKSQTDGYDAKLKAAGALFQSLGVGEANATELELRLGTSNMMKLAFGLAEKFGEPVKGDQGKDPGSLGGGDTSDAKAQLTEFDKANREKINAGDPETMNLRRRLLDAANAQAIPKKPA